MDINIDNFKNLIEKLKTIGFFERIFGWNKIKQLLIGAAVDLQKVMTEIDTTKNENSNLKNDLSIKSLTIENLTSKVNDLNLDNNSLNEHKTILSNENRKIASDNATLVESVAQLSKRKNELDIELAELKQELKTTIEERDDFKIQNTRFLNEEETRAQECNRSLLALKDMKDHIQDERNQETEERNRIEIERISRLKEMWSNHEEEVKNRIKLICNKHNIAYIEKVPFKGTPDNTLKICDEYIVFDAKSPGGDSLTNFPKYIKDQTENVKKYVKEENVRRDVFFVVPSNTLEILQHFVYPLGDYTIFVVSVDSLEPIILSLQKIEDYEFAEQLTPEERDNICRVLGKFVHLTKRRIQIDSFFINQFMELAYKCENDLPTDVLNKAIEFEKAEKLNPPMEKRAKQISLKELDKNNKKIRTETDARGIIIQEDIISTELNKLPNVSFDTSIPTNCLNSITLFLSETIIC